MQVENLSNYYDIREAIKQMDYETVVYQLLREHFDEETTVSAMSVYRYMVASGIGVGTDMKRIIECLHVVIKKIEDDKTGEESSEWVFKNKRWEK